MNMRMCESVKYVKRRLRDMEGEKGRGYRLTAKWRAFEPFGHAHRPPQLPRPSTTAQHHRSSLLYTSIDEGIAVKNGLVTRQSVHWPATCPPGRWSPPALHCAAAPPGAHLYHLARRHLSNGRLCQGPRLWHVTKA
jgi:hypothetical protein